jgi:hypothetical protein
VTAFWMKARVPLYRCCLTFRGQKSCDGAVSALGICVCSKKLETAKVNTSCALDAPSIDWVHRAIGRIHHGGRLKPSVLIAEVAMYWGHSEPESRLWLTQMVSPVACWLQPELIDPPPR